MRERKREHEIAVCNRLLKALEINARFLRVGDDRSEPDVIYLVSKGTLGIEVATAYCDDFHANWAWNKGIGDKICVQEPDAQMSARIQHEILDKCSRGYVGVDRVWLCISRQGDFGSERDVINECIKHLEIPESHGFEKILLEVRASSHEGGWQAVELPLGTWFSSGGEN